MAVITARAAGSTKPLEMLVVSRACCVVWAGVGTSGWAITGATVTGARATCVVVPVLEQAARVMASSGVARRAMRFMGFAISWTI